MLLLGLRQRYDNDPEFRLHCKMVTALAFVPVPQIRASYEELEAAIPDNVKDDISPILDWMEDNYIGRRNRTPPFPPHLW